MRNLPLILLLIVCLSGCIGLTDQKLLQTKPELDLKSTKTVQEYVTCIKPVWLKMMGYQEEHIAQGIRLLDRRNSEIVRFILDIIEGENGGSNIKFYNGLGTTFALGDVLFPIQNCAKF